MLAARQQQRIHQSLARDRRPLDAVKLGVDEGDVEGGVVNHQRRVADEFEKLFHHMGEQRLAGKELGGQAVHGESLGRHFALRIEMTVKRLSGRHAIEDFHATDLDQPVAPQRVEAGGFGIENDFAH